MSTSRKITIGVLVLAVIYGIGWLAPKQPEPLTHPASAEPSPKPEGPPPAESHQSWSGPFVEESEMDDSQSIEYRLYAERADHALSSNLIQLPPEFGFGCSGQRTYVFVDLRTAVDPTDHAARVRFDNAPPVSLLGHTDDKRNVWYAGGDSAAFMRRVAKTTELRVELKPFLGERTIVTFHVAGLGDERLRSIATACHWK